MIPLVRYGKQPKALPSHWRYLSEFVAETLQASRTPQGGPLTDEENIHLLGANFWVQPIYQELLHAASGHNASVDGERKRPCSGLVKIVAKQRRAKTRAPAVDTACVSDWIGGFCPADSLMIWFPAHWAPQVIRELESREQDFRQMFPQWFDEQFPAKYRKQYQDARDSRTLHFQNRQYLKSSIKLLTASIRVDWFSLPMEKFLDRMPQLRQGLIRGVFQTKASSPWAGNKSQSIQVSLCLPNKRDLDTWYEAVFALPIAWPDITDIDPHYLKKTSAHQLLFIRMQMGVSHNGTCQNIICGTSDLATMLGVSRNCLSSMAVSAGGRCQRLRVAPIVLASMEEIGKYQEGD